MTNVICHNIEGFKSLHNSTRWPLVFSVSLVVMSGDSILLIPGISSRRGWKSAERVVEDVPATAVMWTENEGGSSSSSTSPYALLVPPSQQTRDGAHSSSLAVNCGEDTCSVCRKNQSRYTCPRCQKPYCSIDCYKNHTANTSESSNEEASSACTEAFFKSRVSSILDLEARERKGSTQRMLNQLHQQNVAQDRQQEGDGEAGENLSDQLYDLLESLELKEDDNLSQEELMAMIPLELRAAFQRDIQEGKIQDKILERWHPWWRRQLVSAEDEATCPSSTPYSSSRSRPLDELLLRIPIFSTICRNPQSSETLLFHLIDILYSFCWTIRLYHGLQNVIQKPSSTQPLVNGTDDAGLAVEAAASFIQYSAVLNNKETRFTSLEQVLSACTAASSKYFHQGGGCNAEWNVLVEDCALLLVSHRLVGRALLEANDLLKASVQSLKQQVGQPSDDGNNHNHKESIAQLRQLRKKLEFFLSWSQCAKSEFGDSTKTELMEWVRRWKSDEFVTVDTDGNSKLDVLDLDIPDSKEVKKRRMPVKNAIALQNSSPLIVEVSSTRTLSKNG